MSADDLVTVDANQSLTQAPKSIEASLITLERVQKLDLLIHLITHSKQSLIVCGAKGIGKTTLLNELQLRQEPTWLLLNVSVSNHLSFDAIKQQLFKYLLDNFDEGQGKSLEDVFQLLVIYNKKVIIVIDDAGLLIPSLIESLIHYADHNGCLRIVMALTHDEVSIKSHSDQSIEDCHFIEIPVLAEKQCGVFLEYLSSKHPKLVAFNTIDEGMIEGLYHKTHGIPGQIMTELLPISTHSKKTLFKWHFLDIIAILMSIGIGYLLLTHSNNEPVLTTEKISLSIPEPVVEQHSLTLVLDQKPKLVEGSTSIEKSSQSNQPVESLQIDGLKSIEPLKELFVQSSFDIDTHISVAKDRIEKKPLIVDSTKEKTRLKAVKSIVKKAEISIKPTQPTLDDSSWLLKQSKNHYTIQVMVLSQQQSVKKLLLTYPELKVFQTTNRKGKLNYILVYGSYENTKMASKTMKSFPLKYKKSWIRRFKDITKDIK